MSTSGGQKVVSLSGEPIYQHGEPSPWEPPQGEMCLEQIAGHLERHLGPISTVFHELLSDAVHVDVHVVGPTATCPWARLVTSGMSDLPMRTPEGSGVPRHLELMITLPGDWRLDQADFQDERWYWPVRLLKVLARLPHKHDTFLGLGHTVPNGDPAEPYAPGTALCGAVLLPALGVPEAFTRLEIGPDKAIHFLSVVPLLADEMELKLRDGVDALAALLDERRVGDVVDPARRAPRRKWLGLF